MRLPTQPLTLDADEQGLISIQGIHRGDDAVNVVNESGMYSLVLSSKKAAAKRFKKWITSEVIPSIRKTGSYSLPPAPQVQNPVLQALMLQMVGRPRRCQGQGRGGGPGEAFGVRGSRLPGAGPAVFCGRVEHVPEALMGAAAYLVKPVSAANLYDTIERHIGVPVA